MKTHYLSDAEEALHSATKFAQFLGQRDDLINAARHVHIGILNGLKALAMRQGLTYDFDQDATLLEMMGVFREHENLFLEEALGVDEVVLLHVCQWSLLEIHGTSEPPAKELLWDGIEMAEKIIAECKQ